MRLDRYEPSSESRGTPRWEGPSPADRRFERLRGATAQFVPPRLLELLGAREVSDLRLGMTAERKMTVLFSDICGFTPLAEAMSPAETFAFINDFLAAVEPAVEQHGGFVDKYIGDAVMALFPGGAQDAVNAALGMLEGLGRFNGQRAGQGRAPVRIGVGLNTGMMAVGIVGGGSRLEGTVVSDAVNLAARLESLTRQYGAPLLIGEQTLYALPDACRCPVRYLDRIRVKGKRQPQSIHEVFAGDAPGLREAKERTAPLFEQAVAWYHLKAVDRAEPLLRACLEGAPDDAPARLYLDRCRAFRASGVHEGTGELEGALQWRPEFTMGVGEIDAQHRELLRQMNELVAHLRRGETEALGRVLDFLAGYVVEHFSLEQRLMREHDYPERVAHELEHRNFEAFFGRLREEIVGARLEPLFLEFRAQVFLLDWFATHVLGTDRHFTRWVLAKGVG